MRPIPRRTLLLMSALFILGAGGGLALTPEPGAAWPACAHRICTQDHTTCFSTDASTYCTLRYGPGWLLECWSDYCPVGT